MNLDQQKQRMMESAGRQMASRALEKLTLSKEEQEAKEQERQGALKKKLIIGGVVGVLVLAAVVGISMALAKLWMYALGLLVVAGIGTGGFFWARPRVRALGAKRREAKALKDAEQAREQAAQAAVQKAAAQKKALEDELLRLKGQV